MGDISVIIPVYNRELLLGETLRSLLAQTVPAREIIVVDDGSTDRSAEVAAAFGDPVRVIRQDNAGPAAARNAGFAVAKSEYIHFFDSDDIALPNKHAVQLEALRKSGADIAYGPWVKGRIGDGVFTPVNHVYQQRGLPRGNLIKALVGSWSTVPHACLFRRSIVQKSGGFPLDFRLAEDQLQFLRCLLVGAKVVASPGTLELYRVENNDKITAGSAKPEHLEQWGRFLVQARAECLRAGLDPANWFAFRLRAHLSLRDLKAACPGRYPELEATLCAISTRTPACAYKFATKYHQWFDGLRHRTVGRRGGRDFRMAPITPEQVKLAGQAGYEVRKEARR